MDQPHAAIEQTVEQRPGHGGRPWPKGVSGNPSGNTMGKRAAELFAAMATDFPELSGIERSLLQQAAKLMARSERAKEATDAVRCANAAARLLASLKKSKRDHKPSYRERLLAEVSGGS